jgi:hypothetical protein
MYIATTIEGFWCEPFWGRMLGRWEQPLSE